MPYGVAKILAIPFDLIIAATGKNLPVSSARIKKLAKATTQFDAAKVHAVSNASKTPIPDAIKEMAAWFKSEGKSKPHPERRPPESVQ